MSLLEELYEESKKNDSDKQKKEVENKILKVQSFLKENTISKWHIIDIDFGDHLLKDKMMKYRSMEDNFTVQDMKNCKGLNYGEYEFCYEHMAVILSDIHHKYINTIKSIIVAPISSTKRKNSVFLEKKFNRFLLNDSYILIDNIQHISLERINVKNTKQILQGRYTPLSPTVINDVKKSLKKVFGIV